MSDPFRPAPQEPQAGGADYGWGTDRPVQADIPAQGPSRQKRAGWLAGLLAFAGLVLGKLKFLAIFLLKFKGIAATAISTGVTALIYAQVFGWMFGVGIVLLILVHEFGHLVVARVIGLPATLPIMIPFLGAFVSMKQNPRSVAQESQMAIGGPVLGTVAAGLCYLGYLAAPTSHYGRLLLGLAYFGFLINLFNLIPVTPLDGGRVLSLLSRWFNVAGLAIAVGLLFFGGLNSPVLLLVVLFGAFSTWQRFRSSQANPAYYEVTPQAKWVIGSLYLALLLGLALGFEYTHNLIALVQ